MEIKICGLRREEDIDYVNKLKPDYVGFVFAKSKRQVTPYKAKKLIEELDKSIKKVGVFVNQNKEHIKQIAKICNLDVLQFHGDEKPGDIVGFEQKVWKSFSIKDKSSFKYMKYYDVNGYLLDTFIEGKKGGTGKVFDWDLISCLNKDGFIILAGGLNSENIDVAIKKVRPQVVDISSGVEVDGHKDFNKMKRIIEKARDKKGRT
ncbi:MAG: phosphoribosylanthranilate isomerase [Alkaliphilus sp.]|nr:phosphoribosylanthranilate isomerase [Alkaliphilus sp.]